VESAVKAKAKAANGPMTADEYRRVIEALDLSQVKAGKFLGVDARTSRKWALSERPIATAAATLLRYMVRHKLTPDEVRPGWRD
jgi:DNA-binding transcriptional regulator YiaG